MARFSSRFSARSFRSSSATSVDTPDRFPASTWARRTQFCTVCAVPMPNFSATDSTADHSDPCSDRISATIRTAPVLQLGRVPLRRACHDSIFPNKRSVRTRRGDSVGGCAGLHFGEVVAVVDHRLAVPIDAPSVLDPYQKWCSPALNDWTGLVPDPFAPNWVLEIQADRQVSVVFTGPDQRQLASGQLWVACIAVPQVTDSHGGTSTSYVGSIRNGFSHLPAPPGLSSCWEQMQPTYGASGSVECASGHRVEVLGHKSVTGAPGAGSSASNDQDGSCAQFARTVTGMADPTAGGRLTVQSQVSEPADAQPGVMADAWCVMSPSVPTQYLFGPLLGLGNAPVPLR